MSLADKATATAEKLLKKYGVTGCPLVRVIGSAYDPETSTNVPNTQTYSATVYVSDVTAEDLADTTVLRTDRKYLMSVVGVDKPQVNDVLTVQGVAYNVQSSKSVPVSGRDVLFKGILRV